MSTTFANTIDGNDIYAKRAEQDKDGNQIDTTYAKTTDIPTDVVPAVTSSDDGKVLKASYSGGQGSYSWQTESGGGGSVNDVEVNGTSVVNAQGVAEITVPAQEQSNWTEADNTDPSYIQNKPTEKNLVAGDGISIATSSSSVTISADETVLWSGSSNLVDEGTILMSEAASNFELVDLYIAPYNDGNKADIVLRYVVSSKEIQVAPISFSGTNGIRLNKSRASWSQDFLSLTFSDSTQINITGTGSISQVSNTSQIHKVVGIKRISS